MKQQNLYLFHEPSNDDYRKIDSELVRLYMNRFIIDEDDQNEIVGVGYLTKIEKCHFPHRINYETLSFDIHVEDNDIFYRWKESRKIKLMQDIEIINSSLMSLKVRENLVGDYHFIIGSSFYMSLYTKHWFPEKTPEIHFDLDEFNKPHHFEELIVGILEHQEFKNFVACTFICGMNFAICKKSEVQQAYQLWNRLEDDYKSSIWSVNNDLDDFYNRMMTVEISKKVPNRSQFFNEYQELYLFELKSDFDEITFLDKLKYNDSYSVGANPKMMEEAAFFRVRSSMLDYRHDRIDFSNHFFPPMRNPPRKDFKN